MPEAVKTPDEIKQETAKQQAAIEADLAKNPRDESAVPGGRYKRANDPNWYNADGEQITKDGKVIKQDDGE